MLQVFVDELTCGDKFFVTQVGLQDVPIILGKTWQRKHNCFFNWEKKLFHCQSTNNKLWVPLQQPTLDLVECPSKDQQDVKDLTTKKTIKDNTRSSSNSLQSNKKVNQNMGHHFRLKPKNIRVYSCPFAVEKSVLHRFGLVLDLPFHGEQGHIVILGGACPEFVDEVENPVAHRLHRLSLHTADRDGTPRRRSCRPQPATEPRSEQWRPCRARLPGPPRSGAEDGSGTDWQDAP